MVYLDTSVLVPLFLPEPESERIQRWIERQSGELLSISEWTLTEFASALGLKVRTKYLQLDQAREAQKVFEKLAAESLHVHVPTRADYVRATAFLGEYGLGLRAGDALHLAIAYNEAAKAVYSLDRLFVSAGRKLKIKTSRPI
jgi:predicted nucleic acid-binding protein